MPTRRLDSSIEWEPIREGVQVRLKTRYGQYLRGNGGLPPWRNSITHDVPHRSATANWILWDVDIVELRPQQKEKGKKFKPKPKPTPITPPDRFVYSTPPNPSPSSCGFSMPIEDLEKIELRNHKDEISYDCKSLVKEGRIVLYDVGNKNGDVNDTHKETLFTFKEQYSDWSGTKSETYDLYVSCCNPSNAKLYPLLLQLPPKDSDMHVVVVPSSFQGKCLIVKLFSFMLHLNFQQYFLLTKDDFVYKKIVYAMEEHYENIF
ncbi:hypothetical protein Lal_00040362 [Lupinus albus]|nr:hypothetical protein Lal_00040362 [Lupinus albus]